MEIIQQKKVYPFLQGGGEMGELTRNFNWSLTGVGSPDAWPQSLRTTVSNLLRSKFPMFLWWGEEMIQFYNDAYRPSLGNNGKHPSALGAKGKDSWPEIWAIISPLMRQVETTGEATWMENQLIPIYRNGTIENVYWTYSYSSVLNDDGKHSGILVTCMETTENVKGRMKLQENEARFRNMIEQAPFAITLTNGEDIVIESINAPMLQLMNKQSQDEVLGKKMIEVLPELKEQTVLEIVKNVLKTGETYRGTEVPVDLLVNGALQTHYLDLSYTPLGEGPETTSVLHVAINVTGQVLSRRRIEDSEAKYRMLFESMDQGYCTLEILFDGNRCVDYRYLETNPSFERHLGITNVLGKTIREIAPDIEPKWFHFYGSVATTGNPIRIEEESKAFNKWFEVYAIRLGSAEERKVGVFFTDITKRKASELLLKDNQELLQTVFDASPNSLTVYEEIYNNKGQIEDFKFIIVNEFTIRTTGRTDLVGKLYGVEFPHIREAGIMEVFKRVATTGIPADIEKRYEGDDLRHWFRLIVNKVGKFLVVTTEDITKRKEAENSIQESEAKLRSILNSAPTAMGVFVGPELIVENPNQLMIEVMAAGPNIEGQSFRQLLSGLVAEEQKFINLIDNVRTTGVPFEAQEVEVFFKPEQKTRYFNISFIPLSGESGEVYAVLDVSVDVTGQVTARQKLKENEAALATALEQVRLSKEAAELGTFDMDLERGIMHWDDRCRTLFGISHHEPVTYEKDFLGGLHPQDRERIVKIIDQAFVKSISNGDYDVEYRTVGVEDGIVRWVRAKGKVYFDNKDKPIRFIGSVLDITEQVTAIHKIEEMVEMRTNELAQANEAMHDINKNLQRSNAYLGEFAHAASHDLKEPIRKIQTFASRLNDTLADRLNERETDLFLRMQAATQRMSLLVDDLLTYSEISALPLEMEEVDLAQKLQAVLLDLEIQIEEKKAVINIVDLPKVRGYKRQLQQLFQNLVGNALKYSKKDLPPQITIRSEVMKGADVQKYLPNVEPDISYHLIQVQDNGIGFEQEYAERIFSMFQRLHGKSEYEGTGIGLSIVRKVVDNHNGFIWAESKTGQGATFNVLLPTG